MRAGRLLSLLLLLQTRGRMTAQELADELEISVRTVYRDVESLSEAGVPVYADRGPRGGYRLLDGYRTRLTGLTPAEAESLFLAGVPGPAAELGLGTVLAAAQLKLLAALPPELRSRAGRIRERFHLDAPGWFHEVEATPHLAAVADAVWHQRRLQIRYRRWGGEVSRTPEPLGLVLKAGAWYLVAQVDGQARTYRVARILDLTTLEERFERPESFDLEAYWRAWSEEFHTRLYPEAAIVRLSPRGLALLPHVVDPPKARAALAGVGPPDADGWTRLTLPTESVTHALVDVLKFGVDAEVLAPEELRRRVGETARVLLHRYEESGVGGQGSEERSDGEGSGPDYSRRIG